ncbi:uncharacterized protein CDAR_94941 [Caerostris darwini]|uniref:Uncharacterized protein n=1 Tax=Caerostris darwini TaxID=1538125 RepID=A0AAV4PIZ4_9ARAC|nr:uncharacterized protein CDAR_94941 [Caerostris darwini]
MCHFIIEFLYDIGERLFLELPRVRLDGGRQAFRRRWGYDMGVPCVPEEDEDSSELSETTSLRDERLLRFSSMVRREVPIDSEPAARQLHFSGGLERMLLKARCPSCLFTGDVFGANKTIRWYNCPRRHSRIQIRIVLSVDPWVQLTMCSPHAERSRLFRRDLLYLCRRLSSSVRRFSEKLFAKRWKGRAS